MKLEFNELLYLTNMLATSHLSCKQMHDLK